MAKTAKMRTAWSCEHVTTSSVVVTLSQYLFVTSLNSLWGIVQLLMESFVYGIYTRACMELARISVA
jgi:hypothetical protein